MSRMRYRQVIWGDAISYVGQAAAVAALAGLHRLTLVNALLMMAVTSLLATLIQSRSSRLWSRNGLRLLQNAREYWSLGRWMVLSNMLGLVNVQAVPWTLAAFHGPAEAAKLFALGNLLGLTHPALFGIGNLIVPAVSRARAAAGNAAAWRAALWFGSVGALLVIPYYLALLLLPRLGIRCFYGGASPYLGLTTALRLFCVCYILGYASAVLTALLNGMGNSRAAFTIQLSTVVATLLITLPLARFGGVTWGLAGGCTSVFTGVLVGSMLLRKAHGCARDVVRTTDAAHLSPSVA